MISAKKDGLLEVLVARLAAYRMGSCCSRRLDLYELDGMAMAALGYQPPDIEPEQGETFAVLFDYKRCGLRDLDLKKSDHVTMLHYSKGDWSLVRHDATQREGYAPSNYIIPFTEIEDKPWYYGQLSPANAADYLMAPCVKDGMFLVRDSRSRMAKHTLSTVYKGSVTHFRIEEKGGKFAMTDKDFDSIDEMLEYYRIHLIGSPGHRLSVPCQLKGPETADLSLIDSLQIFQVDRNRLQFKKIIGKGNFSEVWEGTLDSKPVAIKTVDSDAMDPEAFIREAEIMCRLQHPNLVALRGVSIQSKPFYIISELMPNGDLLMYLRGNREFLTETNLMDFSLQIAEGMKYLEQQNYIHRDLAARNILVGNSNRVKIADFGLTRLMGDHRTPISYVIPVRWTAPEAYFLRQYSVKSDVWSFGVLLFEIFSLGGIPYSDIQSNIEVMERVKVGERMAKPSQASDNIYQLMQDTWEYVPEMRPSFGQIVELLRNLSVSKIK